MNNPFIFPIILRQDREYGGSSPPPPPLPPPPPAFAGPSSAASFVADPSTCRQTMELVGVAGPVRFVQEITSSSWSEQTSPELQPSLVFSDGKWYLEFAPSQEVSLNINIGNPSGTMTAAIGMLIIATDATRPIPFNTAPNESFNIAGQDDAAIVFNDGNQNPNYNGLTIVDGEYTTFIAEATASETEDDNSIKVNQNGVDLGEAFGQGVDNLPFTSQTRLGLSGSATQNVLVHAFVVCITTPADHTDLTTYLNT